MPGKRALAWGLVLALLLITGCWDRMEVEDQSYIVALGLDRTDDGLLLVTARVAVTQQTATAPSGAGTSSVLLTARSHTVSEGIYVLNGAMTRRLDLRHLRAVVLGESVSLEGVEPVLMELFRHPLARGSGLLVQARGNARDLLQGNYPVGEANQGKMVEGFLLQAKQLHQGPPVRMQHFLSRLAAPGGDGYIPSAALNPVVAAGEPAETTPVRPSAKAGELPRTGGNPNEVVGTAVFRGDRLAGYLTIDETQALLAMRGEMGKAYITFADPLQPGAYLSLRFHMENKPKYRRWWEGGKPRVSVEMLFEGEALALPGGIDYVKVENRRKLEEAAAREMEKTARGLLEQLQEWGADPVGFGHLFRSDFPTWKAWQAYEWRGHVPDLQVEVKATMRMRRYGLYTGPDRVRGGR